MPAAAAGSVRDAWAFVLVGGFDCRQDTIRGIHTDVLIVHRHRKDLMQNILDGFQRVQRHLAIADDAVIIAADIRLADVLELHHADLIPDEPIVHINVIGEGMLFQATLFLRHSSNRSFRVRLHSGMRMPSAKSCWIFSSFSHSPSKVAS